MKQIKKINYLFICMLFGLMTVMPGYAQDATESAPAVTEAHMGVGAMIEKAVLGILAICALLVVVILIEKFMFWMKTNGNSKKLSTILTPVIEGGDIEQLTSACKDSDAPLAKVITPILTIGQPLRPDQSLLLLRNNVHEAADGQKKFLSILATLAGTAPFIGLFGTVMGILETFSAIGDSGFSNPAAISAGISSALVATAAGLAVAIPAVMFYNYYVRKANQSLDHAERKATEILILFGRM
ncbi:MAG: MotA/TolQ/ExbB proton channel family protein [Lentisphaeria bacterium]|nr:MotA/TolQ/ExbB proton channel family protein [Lentisphaeria bacterium]NQZ68749.1 MotA/TolQ/ExbB proton channel family protein [Lentisphaeria bacterium]